MLRKLIIDTLQKSEYEITEYNMMRVYFTVRSNYDRLDYSFDKFKIDVDNNRVQSINDEIIWSVWQSWSEV